MRTLLATFRLVGRLFRPAIGLSEVGSAMVELVAMLVAMLVRLLGAAWIGTIDDAVEVN